MRLILPLDLPGLRAVNAYLVTDEDGFLLVDCGISDPRVEDGGWSDLVAALEACGVRTTDLTRVLCTHHHADHYGMAARLLGAAGCELWMHERTDADLDLYREPERSARRLRALLESYGVVSVDARDLVGHEDWRPYVSGVAAPHVGLRDGQEVKVGARAWTVLHTPGHARSHICLWCDDERILVSGDHLLPAITPHIDVGAGGEDALGDYLAGLERIERLAPDLVLPGHGRPFREGGERARATLRHHDRRLGAVLQVVRNQPRSAAAISEQIFGAHLMDFHKRLALGEALAHLVYLERRGEVERFHEGDEVLYRRRRH
jgi:glyoxylase-like metal-dependent hydrolase (beta-lactamase superfamily II)